MHTVCDLKGTLDMQGIPMMPSFSSPLVLSAY